MSSQILIALVGLCGVLLGAALNSIGSFLLSKQRFAQDSMVRAYGLYLNSLSLIAASPPNSSERWKGVAGMIEAKGQIALFGSPQVVELLSAFSAKHKNINEKNAAELAEVIEIMRRDCSSREIPALASHLRGLLFVTGEEK